MLGPESVTREARPVTLAFSADQLKSKHTQCGGQASPSGSSFERHVTDWAREAQARAGSKSAMSSSVRPRSARSAAISPIADAIL